MRNVVVMLMCFSIVALADWGTSDSSNLSTIKQDVAVSRSYLYNIEDVLDNNLYSIKETLYAYTNYMMSNGLWGVDNVSQMVDGGNTYDSVILKVGDNTTYGSISEGNLENAMNRVLPANMQYSERNGWGQAEFSNVSDRTRSYVNFLNDINSKIGGDVDGFIDNWMDDSLFIQVYDYNNDLNNGVQNDGAVSEGQLANAFTDYNKVLSMSNAFTTYMSNYVPDNDVLFTLDLSSIGYALSRLTGRGNAWTDFQLEVSLNPTDDRKELKALHTAWMKFYDEKNGVVIINICFILATILAMWSQFKSVLQMD